MQSKNVQYTRGVADREEVEGITYKDLGKRQLNKVRGKSSHEQRQTLKQTKYSEYLQGGKYKYKYKCERYCQGKEENIYWEVTVCQDLSKFRHYIWQNLKNLWPILGDLFNICPNFLPNSLIFTLSGKFLLLKRQNIEN